MIVQKTAPPEQQPATFAFSAENLEKAKSIVARYPDYYNDVIPRAIKRVFGILQPLITFMLIGIVAVVALSIILPLTQMMKVPK